MESGSGGGGEREALAGDPGAGCPDCQEVAEGVRGGRRRGCLKRHKKKCWAALSCCCVVVVLPPIVFFLLFASYFTSSIRPTQHLEAERWPVADQDGYYLAYKENGRWMNWWSRKRHSIMAYFLRVAPSKDLSNIPSQSELDITMPVMEPYWTRSEVRVNESGVRATWIGHATVLAEVDGAMVLTDPMLGPRASPFSWIGGVKRYRPPACQVDELPEGLVAVVVSHNHYDHLDSPTVEKLHRRYGEGLHWFVPMDMGKWFVDNFGIPEGNIHEMVWWDEKEIPGTDVKIVMAPSNHGCRRGLTDEDKALWGSWAVIGPKHRFWFGGDTAYSDGFEQIGRRLGPFDLSAIPIGAYHPRWFMSFVHVDTREAVKIHKDIRSRLSLGIHWGTFKMTREFYLEPKSKLREELEEEGLDQAEFVTVELGETLEPKRD